MKRYDLESAGGWLGDHKVEREDGDYCWYDDAAATIAAQAAEIEGLEEIRLKAISVVSCYESYTGMEPAIQWDSILAEIVAGLKALVYRDYATREEGEGDGNG